MMYKKVIIIIVIVVYLALGFVLLFSNTENEIQPYTKTIVRTIAIFFLLLALYLIYRFKRIVR